MNRTIALSCALLTLVAGGASAIVVEAEFVGSIDFSRFRNYAWRQGTPAPNFQVEQAIREAVDSQLAAKGYRAGLTDFQNVLDSQRFLAQQQDVFATSEGQLV